MQCDPKDDRKLRPGQCRAGEVPHTPLARVMHKLASQSLRKVEFMRLRDIGALAGFASLTLAALLVGSSASQRKSRKLWYRALRKPPQTPPDWVFGAVWPGLYSAIAYSGYRIWQKRSAADGKPALALWGTQLATNAAWSPLFFGKHRSRAALADLGVTLATATAYAAKAARVDRAAALLMLPYVGWLAYAGTLNLGIVRRNPKWLAG